MDIRLLLNPSVTPPKNPRVPLAVVAPQATHSNVQQPLFYPSKSPSDSSSYAGSGQSEKSSASPPRLATSAQRSGETRRRLNNLNKTIITKKRATPPQIAYMVDFFKQNKFPTMVQKQQIGIAIDMLPHAVGVWFQNKRQSDKAIQEANGFEVPKGRGQRGDLKPESYDEHLKRKRQKENDNPESTSSISPTSSTYE